MQSHPQAFLLVLDLLETDAPVWMIGDRIEADMRGAQAQRVPRYPQIGRPLTRDDVVLSGDDYWNAINLLGEDGIDDFVATEVLSKKQNYATKMNDTLKRMLQDPDLREHTRRDVSDAFKRWFEGAGDLLQDWNESVFGRGDIEYKTLPHIRMFIYYFFVKYFQSNVDGKKHQSGDLYDRMYLVESVTLGHFVTDDKDLKRNRRANQWYRS